MRELLVHRSTLTWVLLMAATGLSLWLGTGHHIEDTDNLLTRAWVGLIVIAFIKVRWILLDFMELRDAPVGLRAMFEVWVIAVGGALIAHNWLA